MAILRLNDQIRLTGSDAEGYLHTTGRATLPKTVNEYNRAMQEAADLWESADCAEGELLSKIFCSTLEEQTE